MNQQIIHESLWLLALVVVYIATRILGKRMERRDAQRRREMDAEIKEFLNNWKDRINKN